MPRRRQGLVRSGIEHVQDRTDQQRVARVFPMVAPFELPFGIDQDVGDVCTSRTSHSPHPSSGK